MRGPTHPHHPTTTTHPLSGPRQSTDPSPYERADIIVSELLGSSSVVVVAVVVAVIVVAVVVAVVFAVVVVVVVAFLAHRSSHSFTLYPLLYYPNPNPNPNPPNPN